MTSTKPPKYVKKARQWVVTAISGEKGKKIQTQSWFDAQEEAEKFYRQRG